MNLNPEILKRIEAWAGEAVVDARSLGGGCIADAQQIRLASGRRCLLKSGVDHPEMFRTEANGLRELARAGALRVPEVYLQESGFLLLEFIAPGTPGRDFFERFGRAFAQLHRFQAAEFGFYEDNFIGATPQRNRPTLATATHWPAFYYEHRLLFQYRLAERNGRLSEALRRDFRSLETNIENILAGSAEPPCLLHGDLWSGNFLVDEGGNACLIDPAVYYGHREADLAMTRLFGGFDETFYRAYQEAWPLPPGFEYREDLYKLYHVLNHLNLFGHSYLARAEALLRRYR